MEDALASKARLAKGEKESHFKIASVRCCMRVNRLLLLLFLLFLLLLLLFPAVFYPSSNNGCPSCSPTKWPPNFVETKAQLSSIPVGQLVSGSAPWFQRAIDEGDSLQWIASVEEGSLFIANKTGRRPFDNPALRAWNRVAKEMSPLSPPLSSECYAFMILLSSSPSSLHIQVQTAIWRLRTLDPTRDVVVILIGSQDDDKQRPYTRVGARVIFRQSLPIRPADHKFFYKFDYQKLHLWTLPYRRVMYLDADIILLGNPAPAFSLCSSNRADRPICAVQEVGKWGGYFNNGMFIFQPGAQAARSLIRAWWKPHAPWRRMCLQDVLNEVYARRWQPLPDSFNYQRLKSSPGHWVAGHENARIIHYKDCAGGGGGGASGAWHACKLFASWKRDVLRVLAGDGKGK